MFRKNDIILFAGIIILSIALAVILLSGKTNGKTVIIYENETVVCKLPLEKDCEYKLNHNTVTIKNGEAYMSWAECKNGDCLRFKPIKNVGEQIICLPNKVIVEVAE